jgi:hypothetical protein
MYLELLIFMAFSMQFSMNSYSLKTFHKQKSRDDFVKFSKLCN